jgi:hypothetical protein
VAAPEALGEGLVGHVEFGCELLDRLLARDPVVAAFERRLEGRELRVGESDAAGRGPFVERPDPVDRDVVLRAGVVGRGHRLALGKEEPERPLVARPAGAQDRTPLPDQHGRENP